METLYYFAYGSNMFHDQMKERCPGSEFIGRGYIIGYKFVYDGSSQTRGGAVANIILDKKGIVWGGLYKITLEDLQKLDKHEGYPNSYKKKEVAIMFDFEQQIISIVYLREEKTIGKPSKDYREIVKKGAKQCNLPEDYINKYIEGDMNIEMGYRDGKK